MNSHSADTRLTQLTPRRSIMRSFTYLLWLFCETASWIVHPKKLSPQEDTRRCYEQAANKVGLQLQFRRDATHDYFLAALEGSDRFEAFKKENKAFMFKFLWSPFLKDPRYFFIAFLYTTYGVWTWQFRSGNKSPLKHKWLIFEANNF